MVDTVRALFSISTSFLPTMRGNEKPYPQLKHWTLLDRFEEKVVLNHRPFVNAENCGAKVLYGPSKVRNKGWLLVEGSLPRLLYGTNIRLILTQGELDRAIDHLQTALQQKGFMLKSPPTFKRVDLVWVFWSVPLESAFLSHFATDHPSMRGEINLYRRAGVLTGVSWNAGEMVINLYDPVAKRDTIKGRMKRNASKVKHLRLEVQLLEGRKVEHAFGRAIRKLSIRECYRVYRKLVLRFSPLKPEFYFGSDAAQLIDFNKLLPSSGMPKLPPIFRTDRWFRGPAGREPKDES